MYYFVHPPHRKQLQSSKRCDMAGAENNGIHSNGTKYHCTTHGPKNTFLMISTSKQHFRFLFYGSILGEILGFQTM